MIGVLAFQNDPQAQTESLAQSVPAAGLGRLFGPMAGMFVRLAAHSRLQGVPRSFFKKILKKDFETSPLNFRRSGPKSVRIRSHASVKTL